MTFLKNFSLEISKCCTEIVCFEKVETLYLDFNI